MSEENNLPEKVKKEEGLVPLDLHDQPIKDPRCKLCNSPYREEAELLYEKYNGNINRIHTFLTKDRHEDISYNAVSNHLKMHYVSAGSDSLVKEYASQVEKWVAIQNDQNKALIRAIAILERELWAISAQNEGMPVEERRKNADTMKKLADTLLTYRSKLAEINNAKEPMTMVFNTLQVIVQEEIEQVQSTEAKSAVVKILRRLKDSCGDMVIES